MFTTSSTASSVTEPQRRMFVPTWTWQKPQWPQPELSAGRELDAIDKSHRCWQTIGPALDLALKTIFPAVKALLEERQDYLTECERISSPVTFEMYMIGRRKEESNPTLLFCCSSVQPRKRAKEVVKQSQISNDYPAVRIAHSKRSPLARMPIRIYMRPMEGIQSGSIGKFGEVYCLAPVDRICGIPVFTRRKDGSVRRSTIGGVVQLDEKYYGLTVAHTFVDDGSDFTKSSDDDDSDIDFSFDSEDGMSETGEEDEGNRRARDDGFYQRRDLAESSSLRSAQLSVALQHIDDDTASSSVVGRLFQYSTHSGLDWALIEIDNSLVDPDTCNAIDNSYDKSTLWPRSLVTTNSSERNILAITGDRGVIRGTISRHSIYMRSAQTRNFQELWAVDMVSKIVEGDCGSWVVDRENGHLFGQIVAGYPGTGVAYIIPAYRIFESVWQSLGDALVLPSGSSSKIHARPSLDGIGNALAANSDLRTLTKFNHPTSSHGEELEFGKRRKERMGLPSWLPAPGRMNPPSRLRSDLVGQSAHDISIHQHSVQLSEKKLEYERIREQARLDEAEMQIQEMERKKEDQNLQRMQREFEHKSSKLDNPFFSEDYRSEPTRPHSYRYTDSKILPLSSQPPWVLPHETSWGWTGPGFSSVRQENIAAQETAHSYRGLPTDDTRGDSHPQPSLGSNFQEPSAKWRSRSSTTGIGSNDDQNDRAIARILQRNEKHAQRSEVRTVTPADPTRPICTRLARRQVSLGTLRVHKMDYEIDPADPDYVIFFKWLPESVQDALLEHTRLLRSSRTTSESRPAAQNSSIGRNWSGAVRNDELWCDCEPARRASLLTTKASNSESNGKKFWQCPKQMGARCHLFIWDGEKQEAMAWLRVNGPPDPNTVDKPVEKGLPEVPEPRNVNKSLPEGWNEYSDASGNPYYVHDQPGTVTRVQWEFPSTQPAVLRGSTPRSPHSDETRPDTDAADFVMTGRSDDKRVFKVTKDAGPKDQRASKSRAGKPSGKGSNASEADSETSSSKSKRKDLSANPLLDFLAGGKKR